MEKILVQRLVEPSDLSCTPSLIGAAIASAVRSSKGACDYVFVRVASPDHVDVGFLREIDARAVVVDIEVEVEAPALVQAEFDYVVTIRPGDPAFQSFVRCGTCAAQYGRAAHGQFKPCACGYTEPITAPPRPRFRRGGLWRRFLQSRPLGRPASA